MATRFELISALYDDVSKDVIRSPSNWQEFLKSSCNNYGLHFSEQLLVYAQKPDAVAVLPMASWNRKFGRWVNKGAKGIALFDVSNRNYPRLKYVFDVSDTHEGEQAKEVTIWHMKDEYTDNVIKTLENVFGAVDDKSDLSSAVISACENAVSNNLSDYLFELCGAKHDSFLEDFSDDIISSKFRKLVSNSVSYTVLSRLGVNADLMLDTEDFEDVVNFNTPNTFNALGEATNNIFKTALLEISKTIFALEKENRIFEKTLISSYNKDENKNERSNSNEDNIHTSWRAALSESDYADKDGTNGILRTEKTRISQKSQESDIHNFIDNLQTDGTPDVDSGTGTADGRTNHNSDGKSTGSDRETQTNEYDDLGGNDEQYQELGEGNSIERTDLHDVTDELPPFVDEQAIRYMLSNPDDDLVQRKPAIIKAYQTTKKDNELINYTKTLYPRRFDEYDKFNKHFGFTLADNGLLMYEGNYKTRTKESVFSWDIVIGIIKELINDGKYLDTEKEEKTQLDLFSFSYDNEPVYDEIPQTSLFTDFGISQQIIDEALCCGFNDKNSRVQIAMHFRRDRGVEYNARMLKFLYGTNGAGFVFNGEKVSFWYDENGISIAKGTSAKTSTATHLTWEQAAVRIRELLDVGRYMPQYEIDTVDDYELNKVADRLTEFIRDLSDDYPNKDNCLQSIQKEIDGVFGYPDMVEKITDMLKDDEKRAQIFKEYGKLMDDYNAGMKIIRFNYAAQYSIPYIAEIIEGMKREPIRFKAESGYLPDRKMFISQDEIDKIIINGKNSHAYRLETYTYFVNHPDKADRIKYVGKDNQSGYLGGNDSVNKTTKGIEFSHGSVMEPYAKVLIKWSDVAKRIDTLINQDKFVTQEDIDAIPDIYKNEISRDLESFFEGLSENDAKPYPNDIEPYKVSRIIKAQLDNPQALDDIENMMSNALALMDKEDRMYQYCKQIYDDFVAYKNGTFKLYDHPNLAPKVKQPSKFTKPAEKEKVDAEIEPFVSEVDDGLDLIGEEIDIDCRHFVVDSVSNGYVSMADQTFADGTGFPIFRRETVEFVRQYLPTEKEKIIPTQNTKQHTEHNRWDIHPEIPVEQRYDFDFAAHPVDVVGKKERFRRNMEAIKILKECEADNRFATPDEQIVLSKYVGWGGIPEAFDENNSSWANEYEELISALSPEEYNAARESTLTAFYTPQEVVKACYDIAENLGFKQGNILEPSCGIGNFIGMKPKSMTDSKVYGIELDSVSAAIAQQLYQTASIVNNRYEKVDLPDNFYDLVTTNVPFGDFKVSDKKYDKHNPLIHDYFFMKSLDKVRTGGIMILITSKGTMDKESSNIRRYIAQRADLLVAIRLPNDTFKGNAGTEVVSDILVLQKRDRVLDIEPNWVQLDNTEDGIRMNKYFVDNPDMVLGNMKMVSGRFGPESTCIPYEDRSLEELLDVAVKNIQGQITEVQIGDEFEEDLPETEYKNIAVKPSDIQSEMVKSLSERAEKVRNGGVDSSQDNMLLITNDGRKLALDQRMIDPLLPDFEGSKVNALVDNVYRIWNETTPNKSAQLVFCDLSTPKSSNDFSVYNDIRDKLIKKGIPPDEVQFIHDANTETKKAELFKKVRSGEVRVLMGSTQKMGAGTNVQNKLIAMHDLDCPWRPADLEQRAGRIIRQGNENSKVKIYRYVTEQTFDAYLYQLVEGKQKFASQIMSSKSPVRSAEDIDETALSYAEIKMLATGNPYIKEKMDLDIQVQKLRMLKSNFLSERYSLEDKVLKDFPRDIARYTSRIDGFIKDIATAKHNPKSIANTFVGMIVNGVRYDEKADAGQAIIDVCKTLPDSNTYPLGEYRGFKMEVHYEPFSHKHRVEIKGAISHQGVLGSDPLGNITRIDNVIDGLEKVLENEKAELYNTQKQLEIAKEQLRKPFSREDELKQKEARLSELNALLNVDKKENEIVNDDNEIVNDSPQRSEIDRESR